MNAFYCDLSPCAAEVAERVGPATYRTAIQQYTACTPAHWMNLATFLDQLERQTGIPLADLSPDHALRGRSRVPVPS